MCVDLPLQLSSSPADLLSKRHNQVLVMLIGNILLITLDLTM